MNLPPIPTINEPLSDVPSVAIEQALDDVLVLEKCEGVRINMRVWVRMNGVCECCLGGSALIRRHGEESSRVAPEPKRLSMNHELAERMSGLNWFRTGHIEAGCGSFRRRCDLPWRLIRDYHTDRDGFFAQPRSGSRQRSGKNWTFQCWIAKAGSTPSPACMAGTATFSSSRNWPGIGIRSTRMFRGSASASRNTES